MAAGRCFSPTVWMVGLMLEVGTRFVAVGGGGRSVTGGGDGKFDAGGGDRIKVCCWWWGW